MNATELERYLDAASAAIGLPIAPEHRAAVLGYLALASDFADTVNAVPLATTDEPAMAFVPVVPPEGGRA
ncbi:hypothetical protein ASF11_17160 [Acidovorax sp. Leaf76]|uniref:DUF4089 domain-containing protein n=1 Tax=unclassified Acidovorax TaxID=2684926 RepID=UPI0006F4D9F3|nr:MULTISPECIES: DUF4089 domain-containing protein [unclassified Acidovorax]KQO12270.1 hypothetical protein ASF11_17160 [Acidovorax sp. Leaf76]KQO29164.1 hypothetical protein ASF19_15735 [Acidovorax sp. Leaf84]KQS25685.1 hypothetical protein ASG27_18105 [Acidovorax sp. Leaf191]